MLFCVFSLGEDHGKINRFLEETVDTYVEGTFTRTFRMSRDTFWILFRELCKTPELAGKPRKGGRPSVSPIKKVAIFLCYMSSQQTTLELSQLFDVTEYSVLKSRRQVSRA